MFYHEKSLNLYSCLLYLILMFSCYFCFCSVYVIVLFGRYLTYQNGLWAIQVANTRNKQPSEKSIKTTIGRTALASSTSMYFIHNSTYLKKKAPPEVKFDFSPLRSITNMPELNIISNSRCTAMFRLPI